MNPDSSPFDENPEPWPSWSGSRPYGTDPAPEPRPWDDPYDPDPYAQP